MNLLWHIQIILLSILKQKRNTINILSGYYKDQEIKKCEFYTTKIKFYRFIIKLKKLSINLKKIKAVLN